MRRVKPNFEVESKYLLDIYLSFSNTLFAKSEQGEVKDWKMKRLRNIRNQ